MPTLATLRGLSASVIPGTSATARSAKNRCRIAFDSGVPSEPSLIARSTARPCSNGSSHDARTAAISSSGVITPLCILAACARIAASCASGERRDLVVAHAARALAFGDELLRVSDGRGTQVAFDDFIDQTQRLRIVRAHWLAIEEHAQRLLGADSDAGSRCVPTAPGTTPSVISGKPSFAPFVSDAVVARERHLHATTQRRAMQRHHDGLRQRFEFGEHVCAVPAAASGRRIP